MTPSSFAIGLRRDSSAASGPGSHRSTQAESSYLVAMMGCMRSWFSCPCCCFLRCTCDPKIASWIEGFDLQSHCRHDLVGLQKKLAVVYRWSETQGDLRHQASLGRRASYPGTSGSHHYFAQFSGPSAGFDSRSDSSFQAL